MLWRAGPFLAGIVTSVTAVTIGFAATFLPYENDSTPRHHFAAEALARRPFVLKSAEREVACPITVGSGETASRSSDHPTGTSTVGFAPPAHLPEKVPATSKLQPS